MSDCFRVIVNVKQEAKVPRNLRTAKYHCRAANAIWFHVMSQASVTWPVMFVSMKEPPAIPHTIQPI